MLLGEKTSSEILNPEYFGIFCYHNNLFTVSDRQVFLMIIEM
jgi:hypothetical protein